MLLKRGNIKELNITALRNSPTHAVSFVDKDGCNIHVEREMKEISYDPKLG